MLEDKEIIKDLQREIKQLKHKAANEALALALLQEADFSNQNQEWLATRLAPALELLGIKNHSLVTSDLG